MEAQIHRASAVVDRIVSAWRGAPPVAVVAWPEDLPVNGAPGDTRGLYHRGAAWVVAKTQLYPDQAAETTAHEVIGHHAVREILGSAWRSFMHAIHDGANSGDVALNNFRSYVREVYVNDQGECNLSRAAVADEITAAITEARFDSASGRLAIDQPTRKLALAVAAHLKREALYLNSPATLDELEGALLIAEHRLRHGGMLFGVGYRLKRWYASATMPRPWNPKAPPMSLAESERLLKAENSRIERIEDSKASWSFAFYGVGGLVLLIFGIGAMASGILDFLRSLFH